MLRPTYDKRITADEEPLLDDARSDSTYLSTTSANYRSNSAPFIAGAVGVHVFIVAAYAAILSAIVSTPFGTGSMHFILQSAAFAVLSPVALVSYRVYRDAFSMSHAATKALHAALNIAAAAAGIVGVCYMWSAHQQRAAELTAAGTAVHLASVHSWLGAVALTLFVLNASISLPVFYLCPLATRAAWVPIHIFWGAVAASLCFCSVLMGILSAAGRGYGWTDVLWKVAALLLVCAAAAVGLVFYSSERRSPRDKGEIVWALAD
jgi:hypothetical protein